MDKKAELEKIKRVSSQMCSAHAALFERYRSLALALDLFTLILSAWLSALAFVDPKFSKYIIPLGWDSTFSIGVLSFLTFCLTLVQLRTDWKGISEAHKRSLKMFSEVKRDVGYTLSANQSVTDKDFQKVSARYEMACDSDAAIPENKFLKLKQKHLLKIELSKLLDARPSLLIWVAKLKILIRDNFKK